MTTRLTITLLALLTASSALAEQELPTDPTHPVAFMDVLPPDVLKERFSQYQNSIKAEGCAASLSKSEAFAASAWSTADYLEDALSPYRRSLGAPEALQHIERDPDLKKAIRAAENVIEDLRGSAHAAWIDQAECFIGLGKPHEGIPLLKRALESMSTKEKTQWKRARTLLWSAAGWTTS